MYLLLVALPLLGTLFTGFGGYWIGSLGAGRITLTCVALSFFLSIIIFYEVALLQTPCLIILAPWIVTETTTLSWGFLFDTLTCVMLIVVTSISTLVHLYSTEYMKNDPHLARFMAYLSFFTFFMLVLVTADNFLQMFVGWEGVGLCSYLLINFWYGRIQANKAALKAMIVNRIGDLGLALGIFTMYFYFQSFDYAIIFALVPEFTKEILPFFDISFSIYDFIGFFLFIGAVGKSAQIGLHTWLPDAMEGPTPVSALIHAATMVTAGVFLICRTSQLFEYAPFSLIIVTIFGGLTCFFAGTIGLVQNDLKKVIAYSTCSQLGYMILACGLSNYSVGLFHLANHAFFKALLFLGAGSVIHSVSDEQDMRKMGGLKNLIPFTYAVMLIGSLSLMGMPFLTGFYSKDVILEVAYAKFTIYGHYVYFLGSLAAFCTSFYSIRLIYLTFLNETNGYRLPIINAHDSLIRMSFPLAILVFPSIFIGYTCKDMIIGFGTNFWGNALFVHPENLILVDSEFISIYNKLLPVLFSIMGGSLSYFLYRYNIKFIYHFKISKFGRQLYKFLNKKWFFDKLYNEYLNQVLLTFGYYITYKMTDRGLIEMVGPYGLSKTIYENSLILKQYQSGLTFQYILIFVLGTALTIIFYFFNTI